MKPPPPSALAKELSDKPAVIMGRSGASISYRALEARSNQIASLFRERGLEPEDNISILMENEIDFFPVVWAAHRSGLRYTPLNWHLTVGEVAYILQNSGSKLLISSVGQESLAKDAADLVPGPLWRMVVGQGVPGVESLESAIEGRSEEPYAGDREGRTMSYSSGTTGVPKGIRMPLSGGPFGTPAAVDELMGAYRFSKSAVYLSPGPLYHTAPLQWSVGTLRHGGTVIVMERFEAEEALALVERFGVTHTQVVPTMLVRMLKLPDDVRGSYDVSSLNVVITAAAPCPDEVKERVIDWLGPIVHEYYSSTEGVGLCMIDSLEWLTHRGSVGRPFWGQFHICDPSGAELPAGQIGQIRVSGVRPFEYHNDPEKTESAFDERGWATVGDIGHLDEEGYLYLSGRRSDLIISGGMNVYPREVEDVLVLHPAVADVAVIGLSDDDLGQRVHAVIQLAADHERTVDLATQLHEYCRSKISRYKCPRSISFEDDFPRMESGKIRSAALVERVSAHTTNYGPEGVL